MTQTHARTIELVGRDNSGLIVTVTPNRVTLKRGTDITDEDVSRVLQGVSAWIPGVAWRGVYHHEARSIRMRTGNKKNSIRIYV